MFYLHLRASVSPGSSDGALAQRCALQRALRLEQARLRQMETFLRLVDRFPQARLLAIVEYFDLPVSRS